MSFCDLKSDSDLRSLKLKPLSTKKFGFDFYGENELFHHESFKVTRTTLNGIPAQKISYIINNGPYKNKAIAVYTTVGKKTTEPLVLAPKMEELFKGRILEIRIDLNEQGTLIIKHIFSSDIKQAYMKYFAVL